MVDPLRDCADKVLVIAQTMGAVPEEDKMKAMSDMVQDMEAVMKDRKTVFEQIDQEMEGLSDEDKIIKENELKERSPAFKELDALQKNKKEPKLI